jgi:hypothetical protein
MSSKSYHVTIPVKTHIGKYFSQMYGHPIALSHQDDFGDSVLTKLSTPPLIRPTKYDRNITMKLFITALRFQVPMHMYYRLENDITDAHIININRYLEHTFETAFCTWVMCKAAAGTQRKSAIEQFCDLHEIDIEIDVPYETLKKMEYRDRIYKEKLALLPTKKVDENTGLKIYSFFRKQKEAIESAQMILSFQ